MSVRRHTLAALEAALCVRCAKAYKRAGEAREGWGERGSIWWDVWCCETRRTCRVCGPLVHRYQRRERAHERRERRLRAGRDVRREAHDGVPRAGGVAASATLWGSQARDERWVRDQVPRCRLAWRAESRAAGFVLVVARDANGARSLCLRKAGWTARFDDDGDIPF